VLAAVLPGVAGATPAAFIHCGGYLAKGAPTADDFNPVQYGFRCDGDITAYTLVVNRERDDLNVVDDFSPTANVLDPTESLLLPTSVACEGEIPGDGVSCFAQSTSTAAKPPQAVITADDVIGGDFDTTDPYCGGTIPAGSKKGTLPEPPALVQLMVSDTTGAEFGPFGLGMKRACPAPQLESKRKPKHGRKTVARKKH